MNLFGHHTVVMPIYSHLRQQTPPVAITQAPTPTAAVGAIAPAANDADDAVADFDIHQGDCTSLLRHFDDRTFDLVVTDPPYIVGYRDRSGR